MKKFNKTKQCSIIMLSIASVILWSCRQNVIKIDDLSGVMGETNAPISISISLNNREIKAADENRLALVEVLDKGEGEVIPAQLTNARSEPALRLATIMPDGAPGVRKFKMLIQESPFPTVMSAKECKGHSQPLITEGDKKVLQYNYQTVYEKDVIRPESKKGTEITYHNVSGIYYDEYLKANPQAERNDTTKSSIYAVPRSDYIHPLYGLNGEILTRDWPDGGHPHHRGIFWAWPEVEFNGQRGDIYALQRAFARPTGKIKSINGPVFAEIEAGNLWMWEDRLPIVSEKVLIRAYRSASANRIVDIKISLKAIEDNVTIATRFTDSYGGFNIRMQTPAEQQISYFTDELSADTIRAWADFNGIFGNNEKKSGLMVLQNQSNPEYPGEWVKYPSLSWVQPTFPTPDTRYSLSKNEPLILQYRLIVHLGGEPAKDDAIKKWDAYHHGLTPSLLED